LEVQFTRSIKIILRDDDIMETGPKGSDVIEINLEFAKENVEKIRNLKKGRRFIIIHISNGQMTQEARKYFGEADLKFEKVAILAKGPLQRLVGNFFLGINKPSSPIKLFTKKEKVLEWFYPEKDS